MNDEDTVAAIESDDPHALVFTEDTNFDEILAECIDSGALLCARRVLVVSPAAACSAISLPTIDGEESLTPLLHNAAYLVSGNGLNSFLAQHLLTSAPGRAGDCQVVDRIWC